MKLLSSTIFCAVVLAAAPAFAADHEMRVTEVVLHGTADAASQFVELSDPGEGFPVTYNFVIYDTTGTSIAAQSLPLTAGTVRVVLANAQARAEFSLVTGEDTANHVMIFNLMTDLPAVGSVCFRRQDGDTMTPSSDSAGTRIHCLGWGNATSFPVSSAGTNHGDAPAAGMSLQRYLQCTLVGPPSPNATNTGACPVAGDNTIPPGDAMEPPEDGNTGSGDDNPDTGSKDDGCNVGAGAGWLGCVGLAGLVIAGGTLRRRKR